MLNDIIAIYDDQIDLLIKELRYIEMERCLVYERYERSKNKLANILSDFADRSDDHFLDKLIAVTHARNAEQQKLYQNLEEIIQAYRKSIFMFYNEKNKIEQNKSFAPNNEYSYSAYQ